MKIAVALILSILLVGCATDVKRVSEDKVTDFSGRWNDTDSRLVSEQLIGEALSARWYQTYVDEAKKNPVLVVGLVKNKTHEIIPSDTFIKDMEREFINSGDVRIVQAGDAREELRQERGQQQDFASPATVKKWGMELGADFILQGVINSIVDTNSKEKAVFYQVDLELTAIESGEKVWIGTKKIKKIVK